MAYPTGEKVRKRDSNEGPKGRVPGTRQIREG